jgi:GNAT superfamily N-acetyltransferase
VHHDDPVRACALADARFHELTLAALGVPLRCSNGLWWATHRPAPFLMTAGTLSARTCSADVVAAVADLAAVWQVRDCWAALDLAPAGFTAQIDDPWMVRPAAEVSGPAVPGLVIRRARRPDEVLLFERTAVSGTGDDPPPGFRNGDIHPAASTPTDGDLHLFTGFLDGEPVATSLAAVHPEVVMIGAVRTRPDVRGRGIGSALVRAAVGVAPDRPAALGGRVRAVPMYERLGFRICGQALLWQRWA